jgi:quercetin dioxygenase-like cupin family protein
MKQPILSRRMPALAAAALLALPLFAQAQAAYPTRELLSTGTTVIGEPIRYPSAGAARVTANIVTIAAGTETVLHRHPTPLFAYILEGELTVDYGPKGKRIFRKGDALMEAMDAAHRGINLGKENVSILTVSFGAEGVANVALEK